MRNYQVRMPTLKRVYNVRMPNTKRVYNVLLPEIEFVRSPCTLWPFQTFEMANAWFTPNGVLVGSSSPWAVTDDDAGSYKTLHQLCSVPSRGFGFETNRVEITVEKEAVDDHFLYLYINQYLSYVPGSGDPPLSTTAAAFNLVTGATEERVNPGIITLYVEDLITQWKFITEFSREKATSVVRLQIGPAYGTVFPNENQAGVGTSLITCVRGFLEAYTP